MHLGACVPKNVQQEYLGTHDSLRQVQGLILMSFLIHLVLLSFKVVVPVDKKKVNPDSASLVEVRVYSVCVCGPLLLAACSNSCTACNFPSFLLLYYLFSHSPLFATSM
jgi:hypothetical protein